MTLQDDDAQLLLQLYVSLLVIEHIRVFSPVFLCSANIELGRTTIAKNRFIMIANRYLCIIFFLILASASAFAQRLTISRIDTSGYPEIHAFIYPLDGAGKPLGGLSANDFTVNENGTARTVTSMRCPSPPSYDAISSVLTIDVSGSMSGSRGSIANIQLARAAADAWVAGLPEGSSECAISTFDDAGLINQDFTSDRARLLASIVALKPQGGTNYNAGLTSSPAGGVTIASTGKNRRIVVFLTDGQGGGNEDAIVDAASKANVTIFCVTLGMPAPRILKNIAQRTGGEFYENVTSVDEAASIYRAILYRAQGGEPCEITWQSQPACTVERAATVAIPSRSLTASINYTASSTSIPRIGIDPPAVAFGRAVAGGTKELKVTLTGIASSVTVRNILPIGTRSKFSISGITTPFTLAPGEQKSLTITFSPTDTTYTYARWRIESDACMGSVLFASGGSGGTPEPSIHLVRPNGGETFHSGDVTTINWDGVAPGDTVRLDYSTDEGASWRPIAARASGLGYRWTVPATPSKRCLARVSQLGSDAVGGPVPIMKAEVKDAFAISPDGTQVVGVVGKEADSIVIWNIADGKQIRTFGPLLAGFDGLDGMGHSLHYSPDGKYLLIESAGRKSHLVDLTMGRIIRSFDARLLNGINGKNSADDISPFTPDGSKLLMSGGSDALAGFWDVRTGRKVTTIKSEPGKIYTAAVTADGRQVITTGGNKGAELWDASSGNLVRTFETGRSSAASAVAGPDETSVATTGGDGNDVLRIWNRSSGEKVSELAIGSRSSDHIPLFSPDGASVILWPGNVPTLVDIRSGTVLHKFDPKAFGKPERGVTYATFSPDGSRVATYGGRGLIVWDVGSGTIISEFDHKGSYVGMRARFTPDGSKLVWSYGYGVEIGSIEPSISGDDRSDAVWEIIVDSRAASIDVNFGKRVVGSSVDSVITSYIRNEGKGPLRVEDITIRGGNASDFSLVSGAPPYEIPAGGSHAVEFGFKPSSTGARTASVEINAGGRTFTQSIAGEGVRPQLRLETPSIDFGATPLGTDHDTTVTALLKNTGSTPVEVTSVSTLGPDTSQFQIISGGGSFTLAPGASREFTLRFTPTKTGRTSTRFAFNHSGLGRQTVAEIYGRGVLPGEEEPYVDPTTFRTIATPNAIIPKQGTIVVGIYDVVGLMGGYAVTDNILILAGGGVPLPDDWGGVNGNMYGAYSIGAKVGLPLVSNLNIAAGFQWARSIYDEEITPDALESEITTMVPYGAISYGNDDRRVSATFGYALKHHKTLFEEFDREAGIISVGGDYRFSNRWKVALEIISMRTLGYIPVVATARYFGHTWAFDFGLGYLGIGEGPALKVAPVVSFVKMWNW